MSRYKRFVTVLIILCFLFSLLISAAHLFIYYLPNKDRLFSTMLSRVLQQPIQIRQVTVQGFVLNPTVMLDDVMIGDVTAGHAIRIAHLTVSMNIWKSWLETRWKKQIVSASMRLKSGRLHIEMQVNNLFSQLNWRQEKTGWHIQVDALKWDAGNDHFYSQFTANFSEQGNPSWHLIGHAAFNGLQFNHLDLTISQKNKTGLIVKAASALSMDFLKAHFNSPWFNHVNGKTTVIATMTIPSLFSPAVDTLKIVTNLKGISIFQLPEPFRKSSEIVWPSEWMIQFLPDNKIKSFGRVGSILSAALLIDEKKAKILSGNIHFGDAPATFQRLPGVLINGYLSRFDMTEWEQLLQQFPTVHSVDRLPDSIRKIDVTLGLCRAFNQSFHRLWVRVVPINSGTQITLHNAQVMGDIDYPSIKNMPLRMDFKKLFLQTTKDLSKTKSMNPITIPPLNIVIDELKINDRSDGKVSLITHPIADGLSIHEMKINAPLLKLSAKGRWISHGNKGETALTGNIQSNNLGQVLSQHHLSSRLKGGDFSSEFSLHWQGSPQQFSIHRASGRLSFYLQEGRIMQLDSNTQSNIAIARLLNLVSLESLSHLLKFNFSNPMKRGFPFENFQGKCDLDHGLLFARRIEVESSLAKINITGRMSLENQTNDLTMRVTPSVSSSIPTIAGLAGGPVVGAATWVVNKIFSSQVNSLMEREYRITGTWEQPKIN